MTVSAVVSPRSTDGSPKVEGVCLIADSVSDGGRNRDRESHECSRHHDRRSAYLPAFNVVLGRGPETDQEVLGDMVHLVVPFVWLVVECVDRSGSADEVRQGRIDDQCEKPDKDEDHRNSHPLGGRVRRRLDLVGNPGPHCLGPRNE